jgi:hypothetical protein
VFYLRRLAVVGVETMTRADRPVTRLSYASYRGRQIVVTLHPTWMGLRLMGTRTTYQLEYGAAWSLAGKLKAREIVASRKAGKAR